MKPPNIIKTAKISSAIGNHVSYIPIVLLAALTCVVPVELPELLAGSTGFTGFIGLGTK